MTDLNATAGKIAKLLRDRTSARARTDAARITDMTSFWTRGYLMAERGSAEIKVIARTLDCLRVGDWIFVRKLEHTRWSDYVYDGFDQRTRFDGSAEYYPGYCPRLPNTIVIWSGAEADIPDGWVLCDGRIVGDTIVPDLRGRCVRYTPDPAQIMTAYANNNFPVITHRHTNSAWSNVGTAHDHPPFADRPDQGQIDAGFSIGNAESIIGLRHGHTYTAYSVSEATHAHAATNMNPTTNTWDTRPPVYALCYIMSLEPQDPPLYGIVMTTFPDNLPNFSTVTDMESGALPFPVGANGTFNVGRQTYAPGFIPQFLQIAPYPWIPLGDHGHLIGDMAFNGPGTHQHRSVTFFVYPTDGEDPDEAPVQQGGLGDIPLKPHHHFMDTTSDVGGGHTHDINPLNGTISSGYSSASFFAPGAALLNCLPPHMYLSFVYRYQSRSLAENQPDAIDTLPIGSIILWEGFVFSVLGGAPVPLPTGWVACDGNGDPLDLSGLLVIGAGAHDRPGEPSYAVGDAAGSPVILVPPHVHDETTDSQTSIDNVARDGTHDHDWQVVSSVAEGPTAIGHYFDDGIFYLCYDGSPHDHSPLVLYPAFWRPGGEGWSPLGVPDADGNHGHGITGTSGISHIPTEMWDLGAYNWRYDLYGPNSNENLFNPYAIGFERPRSGMAAPTSLYPNVVGMIFIKKVA